ncbi:MAG: manganese efflux pump [Planctomycetota bacterium]|nr:MAG: manganese efflux pump [Planctomycetota bacterium]
MTYYEITILAFALAADAFSVGASVGLTHNRALQIMRLSFFFGFFQAAMPLIGFAAGALVLVYVEAFDHWLAFGLLALIGIKMIYESFRGGEDHADDKDLTTGLSLIVLSVAVSIDALAAGVTLATSKAPLVFSIIIIGSTASIATLIAMLFAKTLSRIIGKKCEAVAGVVLIALGVKILIEHYISK